jgi:hypothetical protein
MKNLNLTIVSELLNQKDNAGRLLLIVTRGVYFDELNKYWLTATRDRYEQSKIVTQKFQKQKK